MIRFITVQYYLAGIIYLSVKIFEICPGSMIMGEKHLNWANLVFVMETGHREKIWGLYRHLKLPTIEVLNIPDEYEFLNEELIEMLTGRINDTLKIVYKI